MVRFWIVFLAPIEVPIRDLSMDIQPQNRASNAALRQLASLKVLSRLLGHELHAQSGKALTLSRDEVVEIQATIDLFIEDQTRRAGAASSVSNVETPLVGTRN